MKNIVILISLLLAGCDFSLPLAGTPETAIDTRAIGLWERTRPDGASESLLILPLNEQEYILSWPRGGTRELFARAYLFEFSGKTLVQLQWLGTSDGDVAENKIYQIADLHIENSRIEISLLNPEVVGKAHASTAELSRAIETHQDHPDLFRDSMRFHKLQEDDSSPQVDGAPQ